MIKRILVVLLIVGLVAGGSWYLLKKDPANEVATLRVKIGKLLSSTDPDDWSAVTTRNEQKTYNLEDFQERLKIARLASDRILELVPRSVQDLKARGKIEENSGNLTQALKWYNKISVLKRPLTGVEFLRARILKRLGFYLKAQGTLISITDLYPFEANVDLGQLYLETFQPEKAFDSFNKASIYATREMEIRQLMEGKARALSQIINKQTYRLKQLEKSKNATQQIVSLKEDLRKLKKEHRNAIKSSIKLWRRVNPKNKGEFFEVQSRIFELTTEIDDTENLKFAREALREALAHDRENQSFLIYLLLARVSLFLGFQSELPQSVKLNYIRDASANFSNVFSYKFNPKSDDLKFVKNWNLPSLVSREDFETQLLLRVCRGLLAYPEYWRLLSSKGPQGQNDNLEISQRIKVILNTDEIDSSLKLKLRVLRNIAILKDGDADVFIEKTEELNPLVPQEDRAFFAIENAKEILLYSPEESEFLVNLIDEKVFNQIEGDGIREEEKFHTLRTAVQVLNDARNYQYNLLEKFGKSSPSNSLEEINSKIKSLTQSIAKGIRMIPNYSDQPLRHLVASKLSNTLIGIEESIGILKKGRSQFPENKALQYSLGIAFLQQAANASPKNKWTSYQNALDELLPLMEPQSYKNDVLSQLFFIGSQFKNSPSSPPMVLAPIVREMFPQSSEKETRTLSKVLEKFFQAEFELATSIQLGVENYEGVQPFLSLILGTCYLQQSNNFSRRIYSANPGLASTFPQSDFKKRARDFYNNGQEIFEKGLSFNKSYFPIQLELLRMEIDSIPLGNEVSEQLLNKIQKFVGKHGKNSQLLYLRARVEKLRRSHLIKQDINIEKLAYHLGYEKTILRQAMRENPYKDDVFIALAETYVQDWSISNGPLKPYYKDRHAQQFGPVNFAVAIDILKSAPANEKIFRQIGKYLEANRQEEQSLKYYQAIVRNNPNDSNISRVIETYAKLEDFQGARDWLNSFEKSMSHDNDFEIKKSTLFALIDLAQANSPKTSHYDRKLLEDSQIENYRASLAKAKEFGVDPPLGAVNNLAFLLANRGLVTESKTLLESLLQKFKDQKIAVPAKIQEGVEETYAWTLFKGGDSAEAQEIYSRLSSIERELSFYFRYAQVLADLKMNEKALQQLAIVLTSNNTKEKQSLEGKAKRLKQEIMAANKQNPK